MLDPADIDAIAQQVARENLPPGALVDARSRPYEGPYGGNELMVRVEIRNTLFPEVTGRQFNQIVGDLQQRLIEKGK